jgi:hypothetical protein
MLAKNVKKLLLGFFAGITVVFSLARRLLKIY